MPAEFTDSGSSDAEDDDERASVASEDSVRNEIDEQRAYEDQKR